MIKLFKRDDIVLFAGSLRAIKILATKFSGLFSIISKTSLGIVSSLCEEEELDKTKIEALVEEYLFVKDVPDMRDKVRSSMLKKESLLVRNKSIPRVIEKLMDFVNTFVEGIAA